MRATAIVKSSLLALLATSAVYSPRHCVGQIIDAGSDLPASGRSLFDTLTGNARGYDIPFPFEKLVAQLRTRAGCPTHACTRQVLIPLGRSLQRTAAIGEYFRYPRVVTAFDNEPRQGAPNLPLLRDRLYLGYQEKSNTIEVISYNEAAGRFEFQLVTQYSAHGKPQLRYAQRSMCASCHQGLSPIFSRPLWQETNANPVIATRLRKSSTGLHGVAAQVSVDEPNAIDSATDRANRLATAQAIWQSGCGDDEDNNNAALQARACRASLLTVALQYRLSAGHGYATKAFAAARDTIASRWQTTWPQGLSLPDNDIPNRTPQLTYSEGAQARRASYIAPAFEPLVLRAPREVWREFASEQQANVVTDLASFFARSDIQLLDRTLRRARQTQQQIIVLDCTTFEPPQGATQRVVFQCGDNADSYVAGRAYLTGEQAGAIDVIRIGNRLSKDDQFSGTATLTLNMRSNANHAIFNVEREGLSVRSSNGQALSRIELNWSVPSQVRLTLTVSDDVQALMLGIAALRLDATDDALSSRPFRRSAVIAALSRKLKQNSGDEWLPACCGHGATLPPATSVSSKADSTTNRLIGNLQTWCASCHASGEQFPPSFLSGTDAQVAAKLKQCAPRILQRLAMWQLPAGDRNKTPMPPAAALADVTNEQQQGIYRREFAALSELVTQSLASGTAHAALHAKDGDAYELLPPCLTANSYPDTPAHAEVASR